MWIKARLNEFLLALKILTSSYDPNAENSVTQEELTS